MAERSEDSDKNEFLEPDSLKDRDGLLRSPLRTALTGAELEQLFHCYKTSRGDD